jgi:hypothetical protein
VIADPKLDRALTEFARLRTENPEAVDELIEFLMARPHTGSATFRIRAHRVVCVETQKVTGYGATKDPP